MLELLKSVWWHYGGTKALLRSPYFWFSLCVLFLTFHTWSAAGWWQDPLSILPNLLGFTLGGYAILIAFGGADFQSFIVSLEDDKEEERSKNAFMDLSATFCVFVGLQVSALVLGVLFKSSPGSLILEFLHVSRPLPSCLEQAYVILRYAVWGFCYGVFIYALASGGAAVLAVFRVSRWFSRWARMIAQQKADNK